MSQHREQHPAIAAMLREWEAARVALIVRRNEDRALQRRLAGRLVTEIERHKRSIRNR